MQRLWPCAVSLQPGPDPLLQSQHLLPALCFAAVFEAQLDIISAEAAEAHSSKASHSSSGFHQRQAQGCSSISKAKHGSSRAAEGRSQAI